MAALEEIAPGIQRWTARHPDWRPDQGGAAGWGEIVACVAYQAADDLLVLIDPLVDREEIETELDRLAEGRTVAIAITCPWHARSGEELRKRYVNRSEVWTHADCAAKLGWDVDRVLGAFTALPCGIEAHVADPSQGEVVFWLGEAGALVAGDALIGAEGDRETPLRICPQDWLEGTTVADVAERLSVFRAREVEAVIPLHGEAVLEDAARVLEEALTAG